MIIVPKKECRGNGIRSFQVFNVQQMTFKIGDLPNYRSLDQNEQTGIFVTTIGHNISFPKLSYLVVHSFD